MSKVVGEGWLVHVAEIMSTSDLGPPGAVGGAGYWWLME